MRDLIPFEQFKKREITHGGVLILVHGCFSRFLNCTYGTKSRNAPQMGIFQFPPPPVIYWDDEFHLLAHFHVCTKAVA